MIEYPEGYWDEIVHVDDDGLGYARRDYPAKDYPVGTPVALAGIPSVTGVVVEPHEALGSPGEEGPTHHVPVRWDNYQVSPTWHHVDGLVRV